MNIHKIYWWRAIKTFFAATTLIFGFFSGAVFAENVRTGNQLLMITSVSCPWCEAFDEEVGSGYALTDESALFPLQRVDYYQSLPLDFQHIAPATLTPTFVIIQNGSEIGRIVGYPGAELFWWRMSEFMQFGAE